MSSVVLGLGHGAPGLETDLKPGFGWATNMVDCHSNATNACCMASLHNLVPWHHIWWLRAQTKGQGQVEEVRTGSFVPSSSSLLPARSAWSSWWAPEIGFIMFDAFLIFLFTWFFHLQTEHSILSTNFLVVFAFFLRIGLDWPPKPCCFRSYLERSH